MSKYTGSPTIVAKPINEIYDRFKDLTFFEDKIKQLPAEQLAKLGNLNFTPDSITVDTGQMGNLTFGVTEREAPTKIVFSAVGSPVPLTMRIDLREIDPEQTEVLTSIDVDLPAMLKPFVGPKLQEAADKFSLMIGNLSK
ncbi:MAG: hypothetical protein K2N91_04310 [Muribaculaceae bacterium]|nr:hypothetical protein [Muribaculaceae bacterium]